MPTFIMVITSCGRELLLTITLLVLIALSKSIKLLELDVPSYVPLGTRAALSCRWQLGPADVLYSVKWYKDGKEFFRHVPRDVEPRRRFPLLGVDVEESESSGSQVVLSPATMETAGRYRCEVSGEGPLFPTVSDHADITVVALPDHGPIISGFDSKYRIGDQVLINCTSGHSQPATQLTWYINGEPISFEEYTTSYKSENTLIVTSLVLDFKVTDVHFRNGVLKVKCLATIHPIYWKSNEESAVQDKTRIYIDLETYEERDSRADRVQANFARRPIIFCECSKCIIIYVYILTIFLNEILW